MHPTHWIVRGFGCGRGVSLALASLGLVTQSGYLAATSIRADLLAVVLQLAALQVARGGGSTPRAVGAGVLCTLALLAKFTAAWAPAAIVIAYFVKQRRASLIFLASWLGTLAVAALCLHLGTSGRMLESFRAEAVQNVGVLSVLKSPIALLARLGRGGAAEAFLMPLAILECVLAVRLHRFTIYHGALLLSLPILLVIFTDLGADFNHLLDLVVLAVPLAGSLWASLPSTDRAHMAVRAGLAVAVCWVLFMCWTAALGNPLRDVVAAWMGHGKDSFPVKPLAGVVADDANLLCEDPWISLVAPSDADRTRPLRPAQSGADASPIGRRPRASDRSRRVRSDRAAAARQAPSTPVKKANGKVASSVCRSSTPCERITRFNVKPRDTSSIGRETAPATEERLPCSTF